MMRVLRKLRGGNPAYEELQSLQRLGLNAGLNLMLLARIEDLSQKLAELEENKEKDPMKYLDNADKIIRSSALPWFRARESPPLVAALAAWTELLGIVKKLWQVLSNGESEKSLERLKELFNSFIVINIYPAANVMLAISFSREDVTPQYVNVVRSNVSSQAGTSVIVPAELEQEQGGG